PHQPSKHHAVGRNPGLPARPPHLLEILQCRLERSCSSFWSSPCWAVSAASAEATAMATDTVRWVSSARWSSSCSSWSCSADCDPAPPTKSGDPHVDDPNNKCRLQCRPRKHPAPPARLCHVAHAQHRPCRRPGP